MSDLAIRTAERAALLGDSVDAHRLYLERVRSGLAADLTPAWAFVAALGDVGRNVWTLVRATLDTTGLSPELGDEAARVYFLIGEAQRAAGARFEAVRFAQWLAERNERWLSGRRPTIGAVLASAQPRARTRTMDEGDAMGLARLCLADAVDSAEVPEPSSRAAQDAGKKDAPANGWRVRRPERVANSYGYPAEYTYLAARRVRAGVLVATIRSSGAFSTLDWSRAAWTILPLTAVRS